MNKKVLVAYASKYGATAGIAERIGRGLEQAGLQVDVLPVERVTDVAAYGAVVLGSAVYMGRWQKAAAAFLKSNEAALAARPVWIFSSGPTGAGDPVELVKGIRLPQDLQAVADRIKPRDATYFGGLLDPRKMSWFEKFIISRVKAPTGDFRDWQAISAWTSGIAASVE